MKNLPIFSAFLNHRGTEERGGHRGKFLDSSLCPLSFLCASVVKKSSQTCSILMSKGLKLIEDESGGGEGAGVAAMAGECVFHGAPACGVIGEEI